jgi:hypothetical protein
MGSANLSTNYENEPVRAMLPGAAVTQYAGVYLSGARQVSMPANDVPIEVFGVAYQSASEASTTATIDVHIGGEVQAIAGEALSVGDEVTCYGTTGRFYKANAGDPVAGVVTKAASGAGVLCNIELGIKRPASTEAGEIVRYTAPASITDDTSFTLPCPAGTYELVMAYWEADGIVTGGLKLGTTSGGAEIFTGWATSNGANIYKPSDAADAVAAAAASWTFTAADTLYLADVTDWDSKTISKLILEFRRLY